MIAIKARFEHLTGKTLTSIVVHKNVMCDKQNFCDNIDVSGDVVEFVCSDARYIMHHVTECFCCEDSYIEDIGGDIDKVRGVVLFAEKSSSEKKLVRGRQQWTFYKLATNKVCITIRWNSTAERSSYSVDVDFHEIRKDEDHARLIEAGLDRYNQNSRR